MTVEAKPEPWEQLYRYWLSKTVEGRPPARADLDPVIDIPHLTAHLMILDVLPDGGYRYRLAGSDLANRLGTELTGTRVGQSTPAEAKWLQLLDMVAGNQKPFMVTTEMQRADAGKRLGVVLPLVDANGKTECILAGVFFGHDFLPGMTVGNILVHDIASK